MKSFKLLLLVAIGAVVLTSCASSKVSMTKSQIQRSFKISRPPQQSFYDLDLGVETKVLPTASQQSGKWICSMNNERCFAGPIQNYVRQMGLVEKTPGKDYLLKITQTQMEVNNWSGQASVVLDVSLEDYSGKVVFKQQVTASQRAVLAPTALNGPCTKALEQVNWNRIASFLRVEKLPANESERKVEGYGTTALEQTIVRWDIQSRPQGADIFWRVVSKTPDVKSTNNKYLTTTPYEATKALDIRGLTYQTSGNVRIILRCEKDGYLPQEKEYDVRMVLDQEEISAFFRLVKEE